MDRITGSTSHHEPDELPEAKPGEESSALFTTETRSIRRGTENPDTSVKCRHFRSDARIMKNLSGCGEMKPQMNTETAEPEPSYLLSVFFASFAS